jgi:outer membrane protein assembly factor BamB
MNISISPLTSAMHYMNGYALGVQTVSTGNYRLINFSTSGTNTNFTQRIMNNITWPLSSFPATTDFDAGIAVSFGRGLIAQTGTTPEQRIVSVDLETGNVILNKTIAPAGTEQFMGYSGASDIADHGKYAFLDAWGHYIAIDIRTGNIAWTSEQMDAPWDANSFGAYDTTSAYGLLYRTAYSGVYAFDWNTGKIVWKYEAPAITPFETPYIDQNGTTVMSFNGIAFAADGKIYTLNTEHTPTQPITRGWQLHCINATTGEGIFKTLMSGTMGAIEDGYMAISESYTGTLYVLGKGRSETTVTAPDTAAPLGSSVVIKGSVLDLSPAQPGTPCVSKQSMSTQMEYIHKQMPIGGLWGNETITGVPVSIDVQDSNGNYRHIGDVTSDGYSGTFGYTWKPDMAGQFTVTATFKGDDSYGSSFASTYVSMTEAAATPTETQQPIASQAPVEMYFAASTIAIIIAIAVAVILLRKR